MPFSIHHIQEELRRALDDLANAAVNAEKFGVPTEALLALDYAATLTKTDDEDLHKSLKALAKAVEGGSDAFLTLGIEVKTADGHFRPHRELLEDIADRFKAMPDGVQKSTLALDLFGKKGWP